MAVKKADMRRLLEQRDKLLAEIEALRNKVAGIELAISLLEQSSKAEPSTTRGRVKSVILDLLQEAGTTGLNATSAVKIANRRGVSLDRASVSSLLSRLKKDEIIVYDGDVYRLPQFAPDDNTSTAGENDAPRRKDVRIVTQPVTRLRLKQNHS